MTRYKHSTQNKLRNMLTMQFWFADNQYLLITILYLPKTCLSQKIVRPLNETIHGYLPTADSWPFCYEF